MKDTNIISYLKQIDSLKNSMSRNNPYKYNSMEDFVLKNGKQFVSQSFNDKKYNSFPRTKKECFRNAWHLSSQQNLTYVEGFAMSENIPMAMLHAWCVDENNKVVDPTWDDPNECSYVGVSFGENYVNEILSEKGTFGILENYEMHFPLLTGKHTNFKK